MRRGRRLSLAAPAALLLVAAALSDATAAPPAFQAAVAASNPILYYQFNETSGTTAANHGSLGATHDGTYNGAPTLGVATLDGDTGVAFNGVNDFVESLGAAPLSLTGNPSFTIETIVFIPGSAAASDYPPFLHWGSSGTAQEVYFSLHDNDSNKVYAGFYNGGLRMTGSITLGTWHHIVMVRSGGGTDQSGTALFVDGAKVPLETDTTLCCNGGTPNVSATTFRVNRAVDFTRFFTGTMDELALYDRALPDSEVVTHFQAFPQLLIGNVDHYLCYSLKSTKGSPKFAPILGVGIKDEFPDTPKNFDVKKPTRFCAPILDKEHPAGVHTTANNPGIHLLCYATAPTKKPPQPKHVRVTGIGVANQFGSRNFDTVKESEICVPATATLP